jgi:hypothetical protein
MSIVFPADRFRGRVYGSGDSGDDSGLTEGNHGREMLLERGGGLVMSVGGTQNGQVRLEARWKLEDSFGLEWLL